ncbi:MAG: VTT domain-containing protein [Paludibacter sp.]|nr:VTT domain-containing protein [Paludibacter sp.]
MPLQTKPTRRRANHNALVHRYYKISNFYSFLKDTAIKAGIVIVVFVGIFIALDYFFLDFDSMLTFLVDTYKPPIVFVVFFVSETFLGLVPPELFIGWSSKSAMPWLYLFVLATMSYLGGVFAYYLGGRLHLVPSIKNHIENKIAHHIVKLKKWGGLFVFIGAMLPIPHSVVSMACGLIEYNFKHYLLWALFRYLRFALYGAVIFQVF